MVTADAVLDPLTERVAEACAAGSPIEAWGVARNLLVEPGADAGSAERVRAQFDGAIVPKVEALAEMRPVRPLDIGRLLLLSLRWNRGTKFRQPRPPDDLTRAWVAAVRDGGVRTSPAGLAAAVLATQWAAPTVAEDDRVSDVVRDLVTAARELAEDAPSWLYLVAGLIRRDVDEDVTALVDSLASITAEDEHGLRRVDYALHAIRASGHPPSPGEWSAVGTELAHGDGDGRLRANAPMTPCADESCGVDGDHVHTVDLTDGVLLRGRGLLPLTGDHREVVVNGDVWVRATEGVLAGPTAVGTAVTEQRSLVATHSRIAADLVRADIEGRLTPYATFDVSDHQAWVGLGDRYWYGAMSRSTDVVNGGGDGRYVYFQSSPDEAAVALLLADRLPGSVEVSAEGSPDSGYPGLNWWQHDVLVPPDADGLVHLHADGRSDHAGHNVTFAGFARRSERGAFHPASVSHSLHRITDGPRTVGWIVTYEAVRPSLDVVQTAPKGPGGATLSVNGPVGPKLVEEVTTLERLVTGEGAIEYAHNSNLSVAAAIADGAPDVHLTQLHFPSGSIALDAGMPGRGPVVLPLTVNPAVGYPLLVGPETQWVVSGMVVLYLGELPPVTWQRLAGPLECEGGVVGDAHVLNDLSGSRSRLVPVRNGAAPPRIPGTAAMCLRSSRGVRRQAVSAGLDENGGLSRLVFHEVPWE